MIRIDDGSVRALVDETSERVLSLYLHVDPSDAENQKRRGHEGWRIWLKNELTRLEGGVASDSRNDWDEALAKLERFLGDYEPSGRTLISFARPSGHVFAELPMRLEPAGGFGRAMVGPLLQAMDEYRSYFVVLIAADAYRILSAHLGFVGEVASIELDRNWAMSGATRSAHQSRFEAHREDHQRRYQHALASDVDRVIQDNPHVDRIIGRPRSWTVWSR